MKKQASSLFTFSIFAVVAPTVAIAQQPYQPPSGPTPRTPAGKVDFSGVWERPYVPDMTKDGRNQKGLAELPYTPWGEAEWKRYDAPRKAIMREPVCPLG